MQKLESYVSGEWKYGSGRASTLVNPTTEAPLAEASTDGIDFGKALAFARDVGGPALRDMTFKQRAEMLRKMSRAVHAHRDELLQIGVENAGNTRSDAKFDVDGASGTLGAYADLGEQLGDAKLLIDGEPINLGRSSKLTGQHLWSTRHGVAVHVNAFNFPAWGLAEKAAVALLAGMPVMSKPATSTAMLAWRMVQIFVAEDLVPRGAFSFVCGSTGDLIERLGEQDVLAFTGSGDTGAMLRGGKNVLARSVRVNVEADSLNAAILGADLDPGGETWDLAVKDIVKEITQKTGQKCTATRRVFVPRGKLEALREVLVDRLSQHKVGDPSRDEVTVGPVATKSQRDGVLSAIERFVQAGCKIALGGKRPDALVGVEGSKGYFVAPTILECAAVDSVPLVHEHEIFGPLTTLVPYDDARQAIDACRRGGGGLVASIYADDKSIVRELVLGIASAHGRIVIGSDKIAGSSLPPGMALPNLVHGGPGRAGGGEELGGHRGMELYMQRTALQGYGPLVAALVADGKKI